MVNLLLKQSPVVGLMVAAWHYLVPTNIHTVACTLLVA